MPENYSLKKERPEAAGVPPRSLIRLVEALGAIGFTTNSMMFIKDDRIAFEIYYRPFTSDVLHHLASCSKSITSTAAGFAISEKLFSLDDRIVDLLPEKLDGPPHKYTAATTVRNLLTMSAAFSVFKDPVTDDWTREFLNAAPDRRPGATFTYDTSATHTLCEIIQKFSGTTLQNYLTPRLFEPLGIKNVEWEMSPTGINRGGGGVRLTTESMAKFGCLYLNGGVYGGRQILPPGWAELATAGHISSDTTDGAYKPRYGFQFWRIRNGGFGCLGMGGQIIAVFPEKNAVFAATANGLQHNYDYFPLDFFCELVLPEIENGPIPHDDEGYAKLHDLCETAEVFTPDGAASSPAARRVSGKFFGVGANPGNYTGFKLNFNENGGELLLYRNDEPERVVFGADTHVIGTLPWQTSVKDYQFFGRYSFPGEPNPWLRSKSGSRAVWTDENTLVIKCHMLNQLQSFIITCHFGRDAAVVNIHPTGVFEYNWLPITLTHEYE